MQQKLGITFVLVTHDQEEALTLSDRIAVMAQGRVIQIDTPAGLYERPGSRAVAAFIGSMNFFGATVRQHATPEIDVQGLGRMPLSAHERIRPDGTTVTVAIRPESLEVHHTQPMRSGVAGVLQARQYLGGRQMLHVTVPGRTDPVAVAVQGTGDGGAGGLSPGQPLWLSWKPDSVLVLDA